MFSGSLLTDGCMLVNENTPSSNKPQSLLELCIRQEQIGPEGEAEGGWPQSTKRWWIDIHFSYSGNACLFPDSMHIHRNTRMTGWHYLPVLFLEEPNSGWQFSLLQDRTPLRALRAGLQSESWMTVKFAIGPQAREKKGGNALQRTLTGWRENFISEKKRKASR